MLNLRIADNLTVPRCSITIDKGVRTKFNYFLLKQTIPVTIARRLIQIPRGLEVEATVLVSGIETPGAAAVTDAVCIVTGAVVGRDAPVTDAEGLVVTTVAFNTEVSSVAAFTRDVIAKDESPGVVAVK